MGRSSFAKATPGYCGAINYLVISEAVYIIGIESVRQSEGMQCSGNGSASSTEAIEISGIKSVWCPDTI
jgi:hypothetical protein